MARILVIEEDPEIVQAIRDGLRGLPHALILGKSGAHAARLTREQSPDLVLMNANLAEVSGLAVLRFLKSREELKRIPVLMLTRPETDESWQAIEWGADDVVECPFRSGLLGGKVEALLRYKHAETEIEKNKPLVAMGRSVLELCREFRDPLTSIIVVSRHLQCQTRDPWMKRGLTDIEKLGLRINSVLEEFDHLRSELLPDDQESSDFALVAQQF